MKTDWIIILEQSRYRRAGKSSVFPLSTARDGVGGLDRFCYFSPLMPKGDFLFVLLLIVEKV